MKLDNFMKNVNSNILLMLYTDVAQPGAKKVGQALETVLDLSNTVLMPIKLLNEKVKANFFSVDCKMKLNT